MDYCGKAHMVEFNLMDISPAHTDFSYVYRPAMTSYNTYLVIMWNFSIVD